MAEGLSFCRTRSHWSQRSWKAQQRVPELMQESLGVILTSPGGWALRGSPFPSLWEAQEGRSQGQEMDTILANNMTTGEKNNLKFKWALEMPGPWHPPPVVVRMAQESDCYRFWSASATYSLMTLGKVHNLSGPLCPLLNSGSWKASLQPSHSHFLFIVASDINSPVKDKNSRAGQGNAQLLCFKENNVPRGPGLEVSGQEKTKAGLGSSPQPPSASHSSMGLRMQPVFQSLPPSTAPIRVLFPRPAAKQDAGRRTQPHPSCLGPATGLHTHSTTRESQEPVQEQGTQLAAGSPARDAQEMGCGGASVQSCPRARKEVSLIPQRANDSTTSRATAVTRLLHLHETFQCTEPCDMHNSALSHTSARGLGRDCPHVKDEGAEETWPVSQLQKGRAGGPRTHSPAAPPLPGDFLSCCKYPQISPSSTTTTRLSSGLPVFHPALALSQLPPSSSESSNALPGALPLPGLGLPVAPYTSMALPHSSASEMLFRPHLLLPSPPCTLALVQVGPGSPYPSRHCSPVSTASPDCRRSSAKKKGRQEQAEKETALQHAGRQVHCICKLCYSLAAPTPKDCPKICPYATPLMRNQRFMGLHTEGKEDKMTLPRLLGAPDHTPTGWVLNPR
ncbi:hypothetical protein AAY473_013143 [Plecturocebus cupreus]